MSRPDPIAILLRLRRAELAMAQQQVAEAMRRQQQLDREIATFQHAADSEMRQAVSSAYAQWLPTARDQRKRMEAGLNASITASEVAMAKMVSANLAEQIAIKEQDRQRLLHRRQRIGREQRVLDDL